MAETPGFGTTLGYATTSGGSYTALAECVAFELPELSADDIKTSHMTSTSSTHTYQAGWSEPGEFSATIHWDKTIFTTVLGTLYRADYFYKFTFADTGSTYLTAGYLKSIGPEVPIDDIVTVKLTFKASGTPTFTAGA